MAESSVRPESDGRLLRVQGVSSRLPARFRITELGYAMPLQLWVQAAAQKMKIVEFAVPLVYLEEERSFGGSLDIAAKRLAYYREVLDREMDSLQLAKTPNCESTPASGHRPLACCGG